MTARTDGLGVTARTDSAGPRGRPEGLRGAVLTGSAGPCEGPPGYPRGSVATSSPHTTRRYREVYSGVQVVRVR
ncbi:hypothetical protein GCM10010269_02520 [Streptomyces humidus]|uniref:Uncharacterized protein n=1 Tax=Streptomyces humidus TaxID=52259 RepID=A0A918L0Q8_9ACTN|nr:hypothetical protein GCM10010269_02520 [Streptomyces humidus]